MPEERKPPVNAALIRKMEFYNREIFKMLDTYTGGEFSSKKWGLALFIFSFKGSEMTYMSNANREDMVKMLLEFIAKKPPAKTWDEQHG